LQKQRRNDQNTGHSLPLGTWAKKMTWQTGWIGFGFDLLDRVKIRYK